MDGLGGDINGKMHKKSVTSRNIEVYMQKFYFESVFS